MFCKYCGSDNNNDSRFCKSCGKPLSNASIAEAPARHAKDVKWKVLTIGVLVVAVLAIAIVALLQFAGNGQNGESEPNEAWNVATTNGPMAFALGDKNIIVRDEKEAREAVETAFAQLNRISLGQQLGGCRIDEVFDETYYRFKQIINGREVHGRTITLGVNGTNVADSLTSNAISQQPADQKIAISEKEAGEQLAGMFSDLQDVSPADLVYYAKSDNEVELCYRFYIVQNSEAKYAFVSAIDGALAGQEQQSFVEQVVGTGKTVDNNRDEVSFMTEHGSDGKYGLEDNGRGITVYDAKHKKLSAYSAWADASGKQYKYDFDKSMLVALDDGATRAWGEDCAYIGLYLSTPGVIGRLSIVTNDTTKWTNRTAVSAMYNVSRTHDFYSDILKRNGFSNNDQHNISVCINTKDGTNAAFGITGEDAMIRFNESDDMQLDTAAHEFTHNVEQSISGMDYEGESGALMEATSDIFAELAQDYADDGDMNNSCDWKQSGCRDLANPEQSFIAERSSGKNAKAHPSMYPSDERDSEYWADATPQYKKDKDGKQGETTNDYGHVHNNSTVVSHAAYLMCNGDLDGEVLTTRELAKLLYIAFYPLPSNCDFSLYAGWVNRKAADTLSPQKAKRVKAAFEAVGIDATLIVYIDGKDHETNESTSLDSRESRYEAYLNKVEEYELLYGARKMETFQYGQEWSVGLAMVQLIDFNGDGNEELLLAYRDPKDSGTGVSGYDREAYHVEVWGYENGTIKKLHSGMPPAGDGGYMPVILYSNPKASESKVILYEHESNGVYGEGHEGTESYFGYDGGIFGLLFESATTTKSGKDSVSVSGSRASTAENGSYGEIKSYSPTYYYLDGLMRSSSDSQVVACERVFQITDETIAKLRGESIEQPSNASNEEALKKSVAQSAEHEILHWFYADLDSDGDNEAFAITGIQNEYYDNEWSDGEIWYADDNGAKRLGGQEAGNAVNGLIEDAASGYKFLSLEHDGHGSGTTSTVFAAAGGSCAEALFDLDPIGHFHEEDGRLVGYTQKWDNGFHEYEWHSFEFNPIALTFKSTGVVDVTTWR